MKLEFNKINDLLSEGLLFEIGDYIYFHNSEEYPFQKEVDASRLYVITKVNSDNFEVISFTSEKKTIYFCEKIEYLWGLKLPIPIRKILRLNINN